VKPVPNVIVFAQVGRNGARRLGGVKLITSNRAYSGTPPQWSPAVAPPVRRGEDRAAYAEDDGDLGAAMEPRRFGGVKRRPVAPPVLLAHAAMEPCWFGGVKPGGDGRRDRRHPAAMEPVRRGEAAPGIFFL
jgi:hypothetical protein